MSMLETFLHFEKSLPPGQLDAVEEVLAHIMVTHQNEHSFSVRELDEIKRRLASPPSSP